MLLTADIGNTSIALGVFRGKKLRKTVRIPTERCSPDKYSRAVRSFLRQAEVKPGQLEGMIVASVVPSMFPVFRRALRKVSVSPILIIGKNARIPVVNLYKRPEETGQDRLVNALAGYRLYGGPLVIVDFGTAVTCDAISRRGEYVGGIIVPGIELSLEVLNQRTALLPRIRLRRPPELLGRDTESSILSGMVYGYAALIDGLIGKLKRELGKKTKVVATGGQARLLNSYCEEIDRIDPHLTLTGLRMIWEECKEERDIRKKTRQKRDK